MLAKIKINSNGEKYRKISSCENLLPTGLGEGLCSYDLTNYSSNILLTAFKKTNHLFLGWLPNSKVMFGPILS